MKKLAGKSLNIMEENLAAMQQLFPEAFKEGKIDFDILRQLLGDYVDDAEERYSFRWNGKGKALRLSQTPSTGTLRPCKEESKNWDTTENLYIEGDNLEVLKLLQKSYHGRVKMIYIDPPYNTGNDFVYKDDFRDNVENYKRITRQVDGEGNRTGTNTDSNGRFHTDWLNMIYPRLRLARNLLSDDGVIFISIDDNEQENLKKICDEIYGQQNFVAQFTWKRRSGANDALNNVSMDHEYVICYTSHGNVFLKGVEKAFENYSNSDNDPRGPWAKDNLTCGKTASERPNLFYSITDPKTGISYPCNPNHVWRFEKSKMELLIKANKVVFPANGKGLPTYKRHQSEIRSDTKPYSSIIETRLNSVATKEVRTILEGQIFNYPKSCDLLGQLIYQGTNTDSIVLDFFSGSATTAHAVMNLNAEDGGNRRFIMVQLPETTPVDSEARKAGYENICEIGKERIRRAGEKVKAECEDAERAASLDIGFKIFKLDSSNLAKWNPQPEDLQLALQESVENFLPGRTELDVVYEILLKMGLDLSMPIEEREAAGKKVYIVGFGALMICLGEHITLPVVEEMAKLHKEYDSELWQVVFRDNGFASDMDKTNSKETLKAAGLDGDSFISV